MNIIKRYQINLHCRKIARSPRVTESEAWFKSPGNMRLYRSKVLPSTMKPKSAVRGDAGMKLEMRKDVEGENKFFGSLEAFGRFAIKIRPDDARTEIRLRQSTPTDRDSMMSDA